MAQKNKSIIYFVSKINIYHSVGIRTHINSSSSSPCTRNVIALNSKTYISAGSLAALNSAMSNKNVYATLGICTLSSCTSAFTNGDSETIGRGIITKTSETILDIVLFTGSSSINQYCIRVTDGVVTQACKTSIPALQ